MAQSSPAVIPSYFNPDVYEALESADNVIFFQWDLTADTFKLRDTNQIHRYALPHHFRRASTRLTIDGLVHPDDTGMLEYYLHRIYHKSRNKRQKNHISARLRLRSSKKPQWLWSEIHLVTFYQGSRPMMAFGNIRNIQAEKLWQERISRRANTDDLTGLLSKGTAQSRIRAALRRLAPERDTATLLIVDADEFKAVNDTFGHLFGDNVLREIGHAINRNFRQSDIKGRIGGDEFVILLPGMSCADILARHCHCLCRRLSLMFHAPGNKHHAFSISIGAAQYPAHGQSYNELFTHADQALYEAKRRGKGQYVLYQPDMSETTGREDTLADSCLELSPAPSQMESIEEMQARIRQLQKTIDCMGKMMCALLQTKTP